jgi:guanylate kinase
MKPTSFIITLTGSSGCGKTYITDRIIDLGKELETENIQFNPVRHWKYVTRPYRESEIIEQFIKNKDTKKRVIDVESVKTIPEGCDFVYRTYGEEYGFMKKDLQKLLDDGKSPIIVINDVRVIEEMKKEFPNRVLSLFLFREIIPDVETHIKAGETRGGVSENEIKLRFEKAVALYRIFIENIFLFDRTILNIPKERTRIEDDIAKIQVKRIIRGVIDEKISLNKQITKTPKLFIISGNAQSGKDDIIRAAKKMGTFQAEILVKYTTRYEEKDDEGEITPKYIAKKTLLDEYRKEYDTKINNLKNDYSYEGYKERFKYDFKEEYEKNSAKYKNEEEFWRIKYQLYQSSVSKVILTGNEKFWKNFDKESKKRKGKEKELSKYKYKKLLKEYFVINEKYIDLESIVKQNRKLYKKETAKIKQRMKTKPENNSALLNYDGKQFVLYENNKKLPNGKPIYYGYEIDSYIEKIKNGDKHIVLTASLPNMFRICREQFEKENVITAFAYSQISAEEHVKNSDGVVGDAKLQEYDDILRYANHVDDFDYALIFAETSVDNKSGSQKDELVDQMFRLFRVYNKERNDNEQ